VTTTHSKVRLVPEARDWLAFALIDSASMLTMTQEQTRTPHCLDPGQAASAMTMRARTK